MCDYVKLIASVDRDVEGWARWKASQLRVPFSQFVEEALKLLKAQYELALRCQEGVYKCGHCGFVGYCYGSVTNQGVSAPFCSACHLNDKLTKVETDASASSGLNRRPPVGHLSPIDLEVK